MDHRLVLNMSMWEHNHTSRNHTFCKNYDLKMSLINDTMHLKYQDVCLLVTFILVIISEVLDKKIITKVKISHFSPFYHRNYFRKFSTLAG